MGLIEFLNARTQNLLICHCKPFLKVAYNDGQALKFSVWFLVFWKI